MKTLLAFALLLNSIILYGQDDDSKTKITWSKESKLQWIDFKAEPNLEVVAFAQTSYKIEILPIDVLVDDKNNIQNYESLKVVANFYKKHSWVYKKSDYLLKHEQLHFDIAGLYAIKINNEFKNLIAEKKSNFDVYYNIYQKLWSECLATQKKYDSETNHGQLIEKNNDWIEYINNQIESLYK